MKQHHKQQFRELVQQGTISLLCRNRSTLNVPFPTAGGKVFWDSYCVNGWKLQENTVFGNWRILDSDDERQAWGINEEQLEAFLNDRPTSLLANYLDEGYAFSRYESENPETVILIHGWGVRANSMADLAEMLHGAGYRVLNYDYPSSEQHIERHAELFLSRYRRENLPGKVRFVTHSMGGLVLRYALAKMTETECRAVDCAVLLGPPNRGSLLALIGGVEPLAEFNVSLGDMIPGSAALRIPPPAYLPPVGIIAGTLDCKVPVENTGLPDGLPYRRVTVDCNHPGLRDPDRTGGLIRHFLRYHDFNR